MSKYRMTSLGSTDRSKPNKKALLLYLLLLSACSSGPTRYAISQDRAPSQDVNGNRIANAVPRPEPRSKYGNNPSYVVMGKRYYVMDKADGFKQQGIASWYGKKFHGYRTSSGEIYNMYRMTAAHKNLPLPSYVYVTNLDNGRRIIVRVNDRGPFHANRIIDLSYAAAKKLGITANGTGRVEISYIDPHEYQQQRSRIAAFNQAPAQPVATAPKKQPEPIPLAQTKAKPTEKVASKQKQNTTTLAQAKPKPTEKVASKPGQTGSQARPKAQAIATKKPTPPQDMATADTTQVYIQVGAYTQRSNADLMHNKIETLVKQKKVNTGYNEKNKLYRVRIGPLASAEEADRLMEQISRSGIANPRIVND